MPSRAEVDKQIIKIREEIKTAKRSLNRKIAKQKGSKSSHWEQKFTLEQKVHLGSKKLTLEQ